jgi:hypothetical protein
MPRLAATVIGLWLLVGSAMGASGAASASGMPPEYADAAKLERAEQIFRITQGVPTGWSAPTLREPIK